MAWLAVDKNKQECISPRKPERADRCCWECLSSWYMDAVDLVVELPKGSIEKLIGKKLTWEDDPVEI